MLTTTVVLVVGSLSLNIVVVRGGVFSFLLVATLSHDRTMLATVPPVWLTMDSSNVSRAPRVGHKKSRKGCAQCKRRHVKVGIIAMAITNHFRKGRVRLMSIRIRAHIGKELTSVRFYSAMRSRHVRTVSDIALRVPLLVDRTSPGTMQKQNNKDLPRHQYRAIRPGHHHTISSVYTRQQPQQRHAHHLRA